MPLTHVEREQLYRDPLAFARTRNVVLPDEYYGELRGRARLHATTIAGVNRLDTIQRVMDTLNDHLRDGGTLASFKQAVTADEIGLNLPPHRVENVFRTNLQTAYMQGHVRRQEDPASLKRRPFFLYDAINDSRVRAEHLKMDGHIARHDDPVWRRWTPPAGFQCRCTRIALTEKQAIDRGYDSAKSTPDATPDKGWDFDRTTAGGDPVGTGISASEQRALTKSDRAFADAYRQDKASRELERRLWDREGGNPDCGWFTGKVSLTAGGGDCIEARPGQKTWKDYGLPSLADLMDDNAAPMPAVLPAADDAGDALSVLRTALGLPAARKRVVVTPVRHIDMEAWALHHIVEKRQAKRERYANFILPTLTMPLDVWNTEYADGSRRERYIKLFEGKTNLYVIVRLNADGSLLWNAIPARRGTVENQRMGELMWRAYE